MPKRKPNNDGKMNVEKPDLTKKYLSSLGDWISVPEAARIIGIQPRTLRAYLTEGRFARARKIGANWVLCKSESVEFAQKDRPVGYHSWRTPEESQRKRIAAIRLAAKRRKAKQRRPMKKTKITE